MWCVRARDDERHNDILYMLWYAVCSVRPQTGCGHMPFWAFENSPSSSSSFSGCPQVKWNSRTMVATIRQKKKNETEKCRRRPLEKNEKKTGKHSKAFQGEFQRKHIHVGNTHAQTRFTTVKIRLKRLIHVVFPFYPLIVIDSIIGAHTHRVIRTL